MNNFQIEPSADQRQAAKDLRGMFLALLSEEFTEAQALQIIASIMAASALGGSS